MVQTIIGKVGVTPRHEWSASVADYERLDEVTYQGSTYRVIFKGGKVPAGTLPTNKTYFEISARGVDAASMSLLSATISESVKNISFLTNNGYYDLSGPKAGTTTNTSTPSKSIRYQIKKGESVDIETLGGATQARGYAITNNALDILSVAPASENSIGNPKTLLANVDGWIYINCLEAGYPNFKSVIRSLKTSEIAKELSDFKNTVSTDKATTDGKITSIESALLSKKDYNSNVLSNAGYYNLSTTQAPANIGGENVFGGYRFQVTAGQSVILETLGGGTQAKAYATTDLNLLIKEVSAANLNTIGNPRRIDITVDGWFYVNCARASFANFRLSVLSSIKQDVNKQIEEVNQKIDSISGTIPSFKNSLPDLKKNTIKLLIIGNSFSDDYSEYLQKFINAAALNNANISVYRCTIGGSNLARWVEEYKNGTTQLTLALTAGTMTMPVVTGTFKQVLAQDWDYILIQQLSDLAADFASIETSLPTLIRGFKSQCTNQNVVLGWQSIWSYTEAYAKSKFGDTSTYFGSTGWKSITETTIQQALKLGIDFIIPTGTAIQNARLVTTPVVNGGNFLTRDGYHLQYGCGRYIVNATLFGVIFCPLFNVRLLSNTAIHTLNQYEIDNGNGFGVSVTAENRGVCLRAAFDAINDWKKINNPVQ